MPEGQGRASAIVAHAKRHGLECDSSGVSLAWDEVGCRMRLFASPWLAFVSYAYQEKSSASGFLRDPLWQFVAAVITVVSVIVAIVALVQQRRRKELTWEMNWDSLLTVDDEVRGELKVTYNDEAVEDLALVRIRITNSGDIPILAQDFERALRLELGEAGHVLKGKGDKHPKSLKPSADFKEHAVEIKPLLLNSSDWLSLRLLVSGFREKDVNIDGRIAGVKEVRRSTGTRFRHVWLLLLSTVGLAGGALTAIVSEHFHVQRPLNGAIGAVVVGYAAGIVFFAVNRKDAWIRRLIRAPFRGMVR